MDNNNLTPEGGNISLECREAIRKLRASLMEQKEWLQSLLEAISIWTAPDEVYQGRHYSYLIGGEAFDWLLLAERLCLEVDGLIPATEKEALLFSGKLPRELTESEFSSYLGIDKYRAHLSYFYGVTVEEALILATEGEIRKERLSRGYSDKGDYSDDAILKIYGSPRSTLLKTFRDEKGHPNHRFMTLAESKEFTYWLFKYRLHNCDRARIASDTKKGLEQLYALH